MHGIGPHPRGLQLWWARRPLAAARAVLWASKEALAYNIFVSSWPEIKDESTHLSTDKLEQISF